MNTYRYTPQKIVEEKLFFSIPLYQRLFSWGEEQIKGLLYDLKSHFSSSEGPYYLGLLSCIQSTNTNRYDLIDGQQRFTMMTLLAIVLRIYYGAWNDFLDNGERLVFVARTRDNDFLKSEIDGQAQIATPNIMMEEGIKEIHQFLSLELQSKEELEVFAKNVYQKVSFFFSELPKSYTYDPSSLNKYFEAMNSTGKSLEQHEILKVQLMRGEENKEHLTRVWNAVCDLNRPIIKSKEEDSEDSYRHKYEEAIRLCRENKYYEAFFYCESSYDAEDLDAIGNIEARQVNFSKHFDDVGERCIITFPEFLMMVADLHLELNGSYSFYRSDLLNVFKNNSIGNKQDFYNQLLFYRLLLDYYIIHIDGRENANKYDVVFKEGGSSKALEKYQSMLYVSQTPFYNWLKPLLKRLHERTVSDTDELLSWIKEIDNNIHNLNTLPKVEDMSYDKSVDRYWFWRLDYYLWERKEEYFPNKEEQQIVDEYVFRANRSIEHLHPQHQVNNDEWTENDVHSFGNLAMISQSFNSQQSDDPVTVKFARIMEQANNHALQSIKMYLMYLVAKKSPTGWKVDVKNTHQAEMYELLYKSYQI